MGMPESQADVQMTIGGAIALSEPATINLESLVLQGCTNVKGLAISPTKKAREKFNVANVANAMPRTRRENDLVNWTCFELILNNLWTR